MMIGPGQPPQQDPWSNYPPLSPTAGAAPYLDAPYLQRGSLMAAAKPALDRIPSNLKKLIKKVKSADGSAEETAHEFHSPMDMPPPMPAAVPPPVKSYYQRKLEEIQQREAVKEAEHNAILNAIRRQQALRARGLTPGGLSRGQSDLR